MRASIPARTRPPADLLDRWGHRRVQGIVEGLSLRSPASEADAADFEALRATASATSDLPVGNEVRVLGTRRGITWGRWTEGPADTLSITLRTRRWVGCSSATT